MQAARPKVLISPLQTGLGVALHHLTGSRYRVEHLHRPEFSSSYSEVKAFFNYLLHSVKEQSWPAAVQAAGLSSSATTRITRSEHKMMLEHSMGWAFRTLDGALSVRPLLAQNIAKPYAEKSLQH